MTAPLTDADLAAMRQRVDEIGKRAGWGVINYDAIELRRYVLALLAERDRLAAELAAAEYALAEGDEFVRKGGLEQ